MKVGKKLSLEVRNRISSTRKISKLIGHKHNLETKLKLSLIASQIISDPRKSLFVSVKDILTGQIKQYKFIREAAKDLKADTRSIRCRIPNEKGIWIKPKNPIKLSLFRNRYIITLINPFTVHFHIENDLNE